MEYKVWINYFLFRLGIRKILPNKFIRKIKIEDQNEPLEELKIETFHILLDNRMKTPVFLRKTVCEKLYELSKKLEKEKIKIKLYDAYRSKEVQKDSWEKRLKETKLEYPELQQKELERITSLKVANPTNENQVGGHQTGGAIDITLIDQYENEMEMGTNYEEYNEKTYTYSKGISNEARKNRKKLLTEMNALDFVNFPAEWWHFCYGDRMWAAYKVKKKCFYGYIKK